MREFYEETGYRVQVVGEPLYLGESRFFHENLGYCHTIILIITVEIIDQQRDEHVVNTFDDGDEIRQGQWVDPRSLSHNDVHPIYWPYIQSWQKDQMR